MAGTANPRFEHALTFAVNAHSTTHQERKGTNFPYVVHPIRVAEILDQYGCGEAVVVAGFLHDTVEDANATAAEISDEFGWRVANLVMAASEPDKTLPWKERKEHTLAQLAEEKDSDVLALVAADKLDNIRSIAETLHHLGQDETWAIFNAKQADQRWYYRQLAQIVLSKNPDSPLLRTLHAETHALFPEPDAL